MALGKNLKNDVVVADTENAQASGKKVQSSVKEQETDSSSNIWEQTLNQVSDSVITLDEQEQIIFFNNAAEKMFGYAEQEVLGENIDVLFSAELFAGNLKGYQELKSGKGKSIWVTIETSVIEIDNKKRVTAFIKNQTEQREKVIRAESLQAAVDAGWASIEFAPDGTILKANDNFVYTLGYDSEEKIIGEHHRIFCEPEYVNTLEYKNFWKDLAKGDLKSGEFKRITKSGETVWINASYAPVKDDNGDVFKVIKIASDISQMVEDRANANAVRTAVDTAWAAIEFEPDGTIISVNENFVETLGYSNKTEIIGKHHRIFCDTEYKTSEEYRQFWLDLANGVIKQGEFKREGKQGQEVWIQACYTPVKDEKGEVFKVIKIATDITDRKNVIRDINQVVDIANQDGDLSARLDTSKAEGDYKALGDSINTLLNSISEPVYAIKELVKGLADGDLSREFELAVQGDFKELGNAYNEAQLNLNDLLGNINEIANLVASSSEELLTKADQMQASTQESASAIQQMAEGAQQQATQTDEVSKLVENVLSVANNTSDKSEVINKAAEDAQKSANEGLVTIRKVVENMLQIQDSAGVTSESITILTKRSEEIARTLNVITDIASQTNLLALNAAIEAARAGDAGRGFAVVAEEIRKLAEDSRKSATDIERVISDVQKDINSASKAIDSMDSSVKSGNQASKDAEVVFQNIEKSTVDTLSISREILLAAGEQKTAINETVKNIEKIVVVSEETAAGTEQIATSSKNMSLGMQEVTATSKDLAGIALQLQEGVSKFKLRK